MKINYATLYVKAVEFYEREHDERIDQETLLVLKERAIKLSASQTCLTEQEKNELINIFMIVDLNEYESVWNDCCFSDEVAALRRSLNIK